MTLFVLAAGQTVTTDDRSWLIHRLMSMDIKRTSAYLYPRIYPLVRRRTKVLWIALDALSPSV